MIRLSTERVDYSGFKPIPKSIILRDQRIIDRYNERFPANLLAQRVLMIGQKTLVGVGLYGEY